jgi:hypothetical protein
MYRSQTGELLNYFPVRKMVVPVDRNQLLQNGTITSKDSSVGDLKFEIGKGYLFKNDAAILNIIAANKWQRPIYFTQPLQIGFDEYLRQDGLTLRLVPVSGVRGTVNTDWMYDKLMNKFKYGGSDKKGVYYDEENRRHMVNIRNAHTILAMNLLAANRKEEALKVLHRCDQIMKEANLPYALASRYGNDHNEKSFYFAVTVFQAGDPVLGKRILELLKKDCQQQMAYYESLSDGQMGASQEYEYRSAKQLLETIDEAYKQYVTGKK